MIFACTSDEAVHSAAGAVGPLYLQQFVVMDSVHSVVQRGGLVGAQYNGEASTSIAASAVFSWNRVVGSKRSSGLFDRELKPKSQEFLICCNRNRSNDSVFQYFYSLHWVQCFDV